MLKPPANICLSKKINKNHRPLSFTASRSQQAWLMWRGWTTFTETCVPPTSWSETAWCVKWLTSVWRGSSKTTSTLQDRVTLLSLSDYSFPGCCCETLCSTPTVTQGLSSPSNGRHPRQPCMGVSPSSLTSGPLVCCWLSWQLKAEFHIQVKKYI